MVTKRQQARKVTAQKIARATAASWNDNKVRKARSVKHKVKVGGVTYNSVRDAFVKLDLDLNRHSAFRKQLKADGRKKFGAHTFVLVQPQ